MSDRSFLRLLKHWARDRVAAALRGLPSFRGKVAAANVLRSLFRFDHRESAVEVLVRMKDGRTVRIDPRGPTESHVYWTGAYYDAFFEELARFPRAGGAVLDVGAHVGFFAISIGARLRENGGVVYAFEPLEGNFDRLIEHIALNDLESTIKPIRLALGSDSGEVALSKCEDHPGSTGNAFVLGRGVAGVETCTARSARLDDVAIEFGIDSCDLIKVDIEGCEFDFLRGGREFIQRHKPLIYLELNYFWIKAFGWSLAELNEYAKSIGYGVYRPVKGFWIAADREGTKVENALMVPIGGEVESRARGMFRFG
jgi:FkbM family methyltransferase